MKVTKAVILILITFSSFAGEPPDFENKFLGLYISPSKNDIEIKNYDSDVLISGIDLVQIFIDPASGDTVYYPSPNNSSNGRNKDMSAMTWFSENEFCKTNFEIVADTGSAELNFIILTTFKKRTEVIRQSVAFNVVPRLKQVFRRNGSSDTTNFQDEYWLSKQGAIFGSSDGTVLFVNTDAISSFQLDAVRNRMIINLDYAKDHPFQHFPLRDSLRHEKMDLSTSMYEAGESRTNKFTIHAGKEIRPVPRLMLNPNGYLAAHVFTEHADWSDLPTHRAVYFGSEAITKSSKASGGFVRYKIPVTKSVFYANPDSVLNSLSRHGSIFKTPVANIMQTSGYLSFLKDLKKRGHEICLHTPDHFTAGRALIEEACAFMQKNFGSKTWIDHGYNNGPKNNREAFVCDGMTKGSPYYSADIWEKYGIKYFWNSYYEDFATEDSMFFDFNGSIMHPYPGFGDAAPQPYYWKHPTRTGNFYSWPTRDLLEMKSPELWSYHFSEARLNDFVQQRGIKFQHCYPAGSIPGRGFWKMDENNKIVIEPEFNKTLQRLASYRDRGLINLTTVGALLDYWIACEKIRFGFVDSSTVEIINDNTFEIKGISFAVAAKRIVTLKKFQQKNDGGDLIFWFDIKAGETVTMTFH